MGLKNSIKQEGCVGNSHSSNKEKLQQIVFWITIGVVIGLLFLIIIHYVPIERKNNLLGKENLLYKTLLYTDSRVKEVSLDSQKALDYYDESRFFYEKGEYNSAESNCRLARGYFLLASQGYKEISSSLSDLKIEDELIDMYIESLGYLSEINLKLYESCEHFESASRYYNIYYNTDVSYDDKSFDMGGIEIESTNEKIKLHDENIDKYNNLLGEYTIELEKRLEGKE